MGCMTVLTPDSMLPSKLIRH